jgi:DNA-binding NarL/FixJ family response regulator
MDSIKVVLVDDHAVVREGTRKLLEQEPDLEVVGEAANGTEAVSVVSAVQPDIVLMDAVMPGLSGVEATRRIKKSNPTTAIVVLSAYADDRYVLGFLEAGAAGYLLKSAHGTEIIHAIRAIQAGEAVLAPAVTARLLARAHRSPSGASPASSEEHLTERELAVLGLAARGLGNKEIAVSLVLGLPTVKAHLVNIFNKMGVGSRTEAVLQALRRGWIYIEDVAPETAADGTVEPLPEAMETERPLEAPPMPPDTM